MKTFLRGGTPRLLPAGRKFARAAPSIQPASTPTNPLVSSVDPGHVETRQSRAEVSIDAAFTHSWSFFKKKDIAQNLFFILKTKMFLPGGKQKYNARRMLLDGNLR